MTTQPPRFLFLCLCLATLLFELRPIPAIGDAAPVITTNGTDFIRNSCETTLYPDLCYTSLFRYANAVQQNPAQLAKVAIGVGLSKARRIASYVSNISRQADYGADPLTASVLHDCFTNFADAVDQMRSSLQQMRRLGAAGGESFRFQIGNVQTWMSAALTDEETCTDGFEDVKDGPVKMDMCDRVAKVKKFTSNALALVNNYVAKGFP